MDNGTYNGGNNEEIPEIMWKPSKKCNMDEFRELVNNRFKLSIGNYKDLWKWSIDKYNAFWGLFWEYSGVLYSKSYDIIVDMEKKINENPEWFVGARLNFAENILKYNDEHVAVYTTGEGQVIKKYTYRELNNLVEKYYSGLISLGVQKGDRVAGYIPNCIEALVILLACSAVGAIWSSTSPDFGTKGVLSRLQQIQPKIIFSVDAVRYNGKVYNHLEKVKQVVEAMDSVENVVLIPFVESENNFSIQSIPKSFYLSQFLNVPQQNLTFEQLPFNHPLVIMYSSGTTGPPKCLVHSAGGTLLQHMKEHVLHGNMKRNDVLFYFTTTGWMMWNWLVGGLSTGGAIVLYDGSPFKPQPTMIWNLVEKIGITILGTSAKWISEMEVRNAFPHNHDISTLHSILSTGSPLAAHQYDFVYKKIKSELLLGSISGGTDIISCFMGQNWSVPVYRGEVQSPNLGMAICCYDETGQPTFDEPGELVCTKPFPCMPVMFWNDKEGLLYNASYFNKFKGIWSHGDFCVFNSKTNGIVMRGRSDATLNPNGVRFGTAELYRVVELYFSDKVLDSLAVTQRSNKSSKERVVLFLKMTEEYKLDEDLIKSIKNKIRTDLSPRHVMQMILEIEDIPYTISGKKVEVAVSKIISGRNVKDGSMLRNPKSLNCYTNIQVLQEF